MRHFLAKVFFQIGVGFTSAENLRNLRKDQEELSRNKIYFQFEENLAGIEIPQELKQMALKSFKYSKSQLQQDLFVLLILNFKRNGFFIEFGAADGVELSNTYMLEKNFGWNGILAEPGRGWHSALIENRAVAIETKCVWKESAKILLFNETKAGELSTLDSFSDQDMHSKSREIGEKYQVETISLLDLLVSNQAPEFIDYLSIDTEGSEYEILKDFDFNAYTFGFISCEHNFTANQDKVYELLSRHGYVRILEKLSLFDDWFVHKSLIETQSFI